MGNQKQKWKTEEEEALKAGVVKHGTGKWKNILRDPQFAPFLINRSNIDLKDKWRNMCISVAAQGSRVSRVKGKPNDALTITEGSASPVTVVDDGADDLPESPQNAKPAPKYTPTILAAISSLENSRSDISAILGFIEQRLEVPQNFRRLLGSKLRRLVLQGKIEKIQDCYRLKSAPSAVITPTQKEKDVRPNASQNHELIQRSSTPEDAAESAASAIAEAEHKSSAAAKAAMEAERVSCLAEEADSMVQLVLEIKERCSKGIWVRLR